MGEMKSACIILTAKPNGRYFLEDQVFHGKVILNEILGTEA
jgi:hypothetical protein